MDTILVLDTSDSMQGRPLAELKKAVISFLDLTEKTYQARVSIIEFGTTTAVKCPFTTDYGRLRTVTKELRATGRTPLAEGLASALQELVQNGRILELNGIALVPRILLVTDGPPDDKTKALHVVNQIAKANFAITSVGIGDLVDEEFLTETTTVSQGSVIFAKSPEFLSFYFFRQLLLVLWIAESAQDIDIIFNRSALKVYLEQHSKALLDDTELDAYYAVLKGSVRKIGDTKAASRSPDLPSVSGPAMKAQGPSTSNCTLL